MESETIRSHLIEIWRELEKLQWISSSGVSMRPLIAEGMQVGLQFCKFDRIRIGHIIAFKKGNDMIVHRVIGFWNQQERLFAIEKGDNNPHCTMIPASMVLGRVTMIKYGNKIIHLKNPFWRLIDLLFVLYGWLFIGLFLSLYLIKIKLFGTQKTVWSQTIYKTLMEFFLFLPRNVVRIFKKFKS